MTRKTLHRGFLDTADGQLHYRRQGAGAPIVLMMTLPFNGAMFLPLMAELAQTHDVLAVDLMGQGTSDRRTRRMDIAETAANIWEGLDTLELGPITLLGGHHTGQVAIDMSIQRPSDVTHLFVDGVIGWTLAEGEAIAKGWTAAPFWVSSQFFTGQWEYAWALMQRLDPELELTAENMVTIADLASGFILGSRLGGPMGQGMFDYDIFGQLPKISVPTTLIGSPTDTLRSFHEKMFPLIANATQHIFDGINPLYQFDRPDRATEYADMMRRMMGLAAPSTGVP